LILEVIQLYELFLFIFPHLKLGFNFGCVLNKKQVKELTELLASEGDAYCVKERRVNIYAYRWQFMFFYLARNILAYIIGNSEFKKLSEGIVKNSFGFEIARYCPANNLIEIFEFNLRAWCNKNGIHKKEYMIKVLLHEYRHKYQFNTDMKLNDEEAEEDADRFAEDFYNKNRNRVKEILLDVK
jgi:hypothetical protein